MKKRIVTDFRWFFRNEYSSSMEYQINVIIVNQAIQKIKPTQQITTAAAAITVENKILRNVFETHFRSFSRFILHFSIKLN